MSVEPTIDAIIRAADDERTNPFLLIGIRPWIVKSLTTRQLQDFLRALKRGLARVYHPDIQPSSDENHAQQRFYARINQLIDQLLHDETALHCAAQAYVDDEITDRLRSQNIRLRTTIKEQREQLHELQEQLIRQAQQHRQELKDANERYRQEIEKHDKRKKERR
jgi:hypothetical protein